MTAPFQTDTPDILRSSHGQVVRAYLTHPDLPGAVELDLNRAPFGWDETRVPRAAASLEVAGRPPVDLETADLGGRVTLEVGYIRPGGAEDVHQVLDLGVRSATWLEEDHTYELECAGDEALVIDASPVVDETVTSATHTGAIKELVYRCLDPRPRFSDPAGNLGPAVTIDVLTDRWNAIMDLADREDLAVYDAGLREWVIEPRPELAATPTLTLEVDANQTGTAPSLAPAVIPLTIPFTVGAQWTVDTGHRRGRGVLLTARRSRTRDEWANHMTVVYEWRDAADVDHKVVGTAYIQDSGPFDVTGPAGKRSLVVTRDNSTTQALAASTARTLLTRAVSRATQFELSAIAAYWVRPGMTLAVQLPGDVAPVSHLVSSVRFEPTEGTMTVRTRRPLPIFPFTGTVAVPEPPPPGTPERPATQTYVSTWTANGSEAYLGSGNRWTSADEPIQGYTAATGNNQGLAMFTAANSTGDETGKSITTALAGLSTKDITKVEVYLYAHHWWYSAGGTARIGFNAGSSLPSTFTGAKPYVTVSGWRRNSGRWVNITSTATKAALLAGGRLVTVGPGKGSSPEYYGRFTGHLGSNKPRLRVTYVKGA